MTGKPMTQSGIGIVDKLIERYTPAPVPPCPVCGRELRIQRASYRELVYGCDGLEADPDNPERLRRAPNYDPSNDHYGRSQWEQPRIGDPDVTEAAALIMEMVEALERLAEAARGLSQGVDWNNGTHAKGHGYRRKLLRALPYALATLAKVRSK